MDRVAERTRDNLAPALEAAVPLLILELLAMRPASREATIRRWAHDGAEEVAHRGDLLMFRGKKPGGTAAVFNALTKGLAALAFAPGGVTFAGLHFEERTTVAEETTKPSARRWTTDAQIDNEFDHHPPGEVAAEAHGVVRASFKELAHRLNALLPECPLKTTALNTVREGMWASNAAIACYGSTDWQAAVRPLLGLDEPAPLPGTVELPTEDQA